MTHDTRHGQGKDRAVNQGQHMAKGSITTLAELLSAGYWWEASVAEEIDNHQIGWWYVENYPLIAQNKLIQVRTDEKQLAPAAEVSNYAALMKMGDRFPAVIVTHDGWLVDGNTRTEAARRNKWETFPAFVLNVEFSKLDPDSPMYGQVMALGGAQNLKHGLRMSNTAIANLIDRVSPGRTPKQIQKDLHIPSYNLANTVWNARRAKDKAKGMGIELTGELSNSHLKMFGGKIEKLTDPVWEEAFRLTQDAHLGYNDTHALLSQAEGFHSEQERLAFLKAERDHHSPAIRSATRVTPGKARRVKQMLSFINNDENSTELLLEWDSVKGPEYLSALCKARKKMNQVIERQEQIEKSRHVNAGPYILGE